MIYLAVFFGSLAVDLVPFVSPPAWAIMLGLMVEFNLDPWIVLLVGVPGSTLGRYIFSRYVVKISKRMIKRHKHEELVFLGKKLGTRLWPTWLFVFIYTLTPLSTTTLFTAAGMAKVPARRTIPPFFVGKSISDATMIFAGRYAVNNVGGAVEGMFSIKSISLMVLGVAILSLFLFVDWFALLERKKLQFNFKIWK